MSIGMMVNLTRVQSSSPGAQSADAAPAGVDRLPTVKPAGHNRRAAVRGIEPLADMMVPAAGEPAVVGGSHDDGLDAVLDEIEADLSSNPTLKGALVEQLAAYELELTDTVMRALETQFHIAQKLSDEEAQAMQNILAEGIAGFPNQDMVDTAKSKLKTLGWSDANTSALLALLFLDPAKSDEPSTAMAIAWHCATVGAHWKGTEGDKVAEELGKVPDFNLLRNKVKTYLRTHCRELLAALEIPEPLVRPTRPGSSQ